MSDAENIILVWTLALHRNPATLKEYQESSRRLLTGLQSHGPTFTRLLVIGPDRTSTISPNLAGLEHLIAEDAFDQAHPDDYYHLSTEGKLTSQSQSRIGFALTYGTASADGLSLSPLAAGGMQLRVQGSSASEEPEASVTLMVGESAFRRPATELRRLLEYFASAWHCGFGGVSIPTYQRAVRGNDPASYAGQWLFYLPFPDLANCLPPDIHHEPFANGILIQTTPHLPDANNPADVAAGRRVRDVLDEFGLVNDATYAIEGWPPDPEETIYEQFISGAPANRKYTVHCIDFDGYDPDRKVLLYAKLFRRLRRHPKAWGLRGWDGPVLNEAKRQVRAAAKAGGVPIEWHIGFEEPANAVRELLANYTDITEQQLQVIYTPFEQALESPAM